MALNKILHGMVESFKEKSSFSDLDESKAYEYLVNYTIISKLHPEAFADPQFLELVDVDDGSTFGLDGISFIVNGNLVLSKEDISLYAKSKSLDVKIIFIQTKTEIKYDAGSISKTINAAKSFLGDRKLLPKNNSIENAIDIYNEIFKYGNSRYLNSNSPECVIYYVTAGKPCDVELINDLCDSESKICSQVFTDIKKFTISTIDGDYIISSYKEIENRIEVVFNFKNSISFDKIDKVTQAYLGYMPANHYIKMIQDSHGDLRRRLFIENVRDYQGFDNPVNTEIRETVLNPQMNDKFVLLNNGITIVAKHLKPLGASLYEMADFNIVNGCQTSYELFNSRNSIENIVLPVKIIHTTDSELISKIVKATNRQTPVPQEAFIALDNYHRRLQEIFEEYSKELPIKIYYERRPGEFSLIDVPINNFQIVTLHGLIRAVTCTYFQAAYMVYNNNPANILRNRGTMLFQKDHKYEIYFVSNYLLSVFIQMDNRRKFGRPSYKLRFYVPMVVRALIGKNLTIPHFNSNQIEKDCIKIIELLKDPDETEQLYNTAMQIIRDTITEYQKQNPHVYIDKILCDPRFNKMVLDNTTNYF